MFPKRKKKTIKTLFYYFIKNKKQKKHLYSPPNVSTIEEQAKRVKMRLDLEDDPIRKFLMFSNLQDRNEHLFYKVLMSNIEELAPIVYTPTVGQVCQRFGFLYRRPRGMHISPQDRGKVIFF